MRLVLVSAAVLTLMSVMQRMGGGMLWDVLTPVLTAVGLAAPRRRAMWWALAMAVLFSAAMRVHPLVVLGVWAVVLGVLGAVARGMEWERLPVSFAIAAVTSLSWQLGVLLLNWFGGIQPTFDSYCLLSLAARPLTAGILFVLCAGTLVRAADPERPAPAARVPRRR